MFKRNSITAILLSSITIVISGLLTLLSLSEWYKVKIHHDIAEYHFGSEGPYPYFYKTAELYSRVNLIWGLVFLVILFFSIWSIVRSKKKLTTLFFILAIFMLGLKFIQGLAGA